MWTQLDTENADLDIKTAAILCLTHTPDADNPRLCQAVVYLGDGTKNLDGTGGNFTIRVDLGSQLGPVKTLVLAATTTRGWLVSDLFACPANTAVKVYVQSPNGADADIDVNAYLYGLDHQPNVNVEAMDGTDLSAQVGANFNTCFNNGAVASATRLDTIGIGNIIEVRT